MYLYVFVIIWTIPQLFGILPFEPADFFLPADVVSKLFKLNLQVDKQIENVKEEKNVGPLGLDIGA